MKGIIGEDRQRLGVAMFGMQDPSQTLLQIERYMQGGRLELSEVDGDPVLRL